MTITIDLSNTYWNNKGKYQDKYNELFPKLVPPQGPAETKHGELLRCVSRLYYDLFNNGLGNIDVLWDMWETLHLARNIISQASNELEFSLLMWGYLEQQMSYARIELEQDPDDPWGESRKYTPWNENLTAELLEKLTDAVIVYVWGVENENSHIRA